MENENETRKWEQALYDKYPKLFRQKDLPASETCMCWGISCGEGWKDIIDDACKQLQQLADDNKATIEFAQVKEKFAGLRLYLDIDDHKETVIDITSPSGEVNTLMKSPKDTIWHKAHEITRKAEELSFQTCEVCGKPGVPRQGGWISTLCDEHANGRKECK